MDLINIIFIALALGMDAFSVAVAAGAYFQKATSRQKFRLSFHFGLFQFIMPIIGWFAGVGVEKYICDFDHWIVLIVLGIIGIKMIYDGLKNDDEAVKTDISKSLTLIILSLATSIDAMAVGFSMALIKQSIWIPSIIIGIVCAAMTLAGIYLGEKASNKLGQKAFIIGGIILILIGVRIVCEHSGLL